MKHRIEISAEDSVGVTWDLTTEQYDFLMRLATALNTGAPIYAPHLMIDGTVPTTDLKDDDE